MNRSIPRHWASRWVLLLVLLTLPAWGLLGCARIKLMPLANHEVAGLKAEDIYQIMQRAGFNDDQILAEGADLRNALATQGAAQIRVGSRTEAIFAVHLPYVHVSCRQRGTFIYDIEKGLIR